MSNLSLEYEKDFHNWIEQHIYLLKTGQVHQLDTAHLIEELEEMGKSNIRELENRFVILIAHLLKWEFQPEKQSSNWQGSIDEQRVQLERLLRKVPSLKRLLQSAIDDSYSDALYLAVKETKLPESVFPQTCFYTVEQLLDKNFYPNSQ
jgi:hypothetical protein